jgi:hypothetical protein
MGDGNKENAAKQSVCVAQFTSANAQRKEKLQIK